MKSISSTSNEQALTLVELLVVMAVLGILVAVVLPSLIHRRVPAHRIKCVNNLKNIGLAFRIFTTDHNDRFPMQIPVAEGGSKEFTEDATMTWCHFAVLSNELSTGKFLLCTKDAIGRKESTTFSRLVRDQNVRPFSENGNLSYFLGVGANETNAMMLLAGDRNITNSLPTRFAYGLAAVGPLGTNHTASSGAGWDGNVHQHAGNVALADGSVQQVTTARMRELLRSTGDPNNRIAVPD